MQSPSLGKPSNTNLAWIFVKDLSTCSEGKFDIFPQIYASFCHDRRLRTFLKGG